jgi:hypothetical protein
MFEEKIIHEFITYFIRYGLISILILYFIFTLIIRQQVESMRKTLITPIGKHITIISNLHAIATILILVIVICIT